MIQNTSKAVITSARWACLMDFLSNEHLRIKSLLHSSVNPGMIRADIVLDHAQSGTPQLWVDVTYPSGADRIVVWTMARPPLYDPFAVEEAIEAISINEILLIVSNQVTIQ